MGGDIFVLVFSLFLAFFMWSMHRLTLEYSSLFEYKVNLTSNIVGRSKSAESHNSLVIRGKTSGFYIVQQHLSKWFGSEPLNVTVDSKYLKSGYSSSDLFALSGADISQFLREALGPDFKLESVASDTLYFTFPRQAYKRVPVVAKYELSYASQYATTLPVAIRPDSVVIYGEKEKIQQVDSVFTKKIRRKMADRPVQGVVQLEPISGLRFSGEEIFYSIDVQRYYEGRHSVSISVINQPSDSKLIYYPQEVKVVYRAIYHTKAPNMSDFQVVADFKKMESTGGRQIIRLESVSAPSAVFDVKLEPKYIECFTN